MKNWWVIGVLLVISACGKDEDSESEFTVTPAIEFVSIAPGTVKELSDAFNITISYKDGDADLGTADPDTTNLYIIDARNQLTYKYRIRDLSPLKDKPNIQGTLKIEMPPTGVFDENASQETTTYSIYLFDKAGHKSNTIQTSVLTITR